MSKDGIRAYDEQQHTTPPKADALAQFLENYHSPLLLEIEANLEEELKKRGLNNMPDANKALRKSLAGMLIVWQFERTENSIFASQVEALNFLNGRAPHPTPNGDLEPFFKQAATAYPKLYEHRTFQDWLGFLTSQTLVLVNEKGVNITVRGREYLKWRVDEGRAEPYVG